MYIVLNWNNFWDEAFLNKKKLILRYVYIYMKIIQ